MGAVESLGALCLAIGLPLGGALVALSSPRIAFLVVGLGATASTAAFVRLWARGLRSRRGSLASAGGGMTFRRFERPCEQDGRSLITRAERRREVQRMVLGSEGGSVRDQVNVRRHRSCYRLVESATTISRDHLKDDGRSVVKDHRADDMRAPKLTRRLYWAAEVLLLACTVGSGRLALSPRRMEPAVCWSGCCSRSRSSHTGSASRLASGC